MTERKLDLYGLWLVAEDEEAARAKLAGLPDAQLTLTGTWDDYTATPEPDPVPLTYVVPSRRHWLYWEVIQYTGTVKPVGDGEFRATGPLTRTVLPRRFWTRWSAQRYLRRHR